VREAIGVLAKAMDEQVETRKGEAHKANGVNGHAAKADALEDL
jgi:hypothetical protein